MTEVVEGEEMLQRSMSIAPQSTFQVGRDKWRQFP